PEAQDRQRGLAEGEPVLAAGHLGPGEDDDVEDLREDEGRDGEVDVAQPRREIGDEHRGDAGGDQAVEHGQAEARGLDVGPRDAAAAHAQAEERRVPERNHAGIADEDVGGHRQEPPDQDLRGEALPERREHDRRDHQQRYHHREPGPVAGGGRSRPRRDRGGHFGVGTKSPVGRKSMVRTSTMNETITAWAGLTTIAAYASSRLTKIEARIEPPRVPVPPTTTTMNARGVKQKPIVGVTRANGPKSTPLAAAIAEPIAKTAVQTSG